MDINRLNEFITLATLLNYSKAANQLYLTQPALSRHIHDLEQTVGSPLFIRDTHNVHLTSIGEVFFKEAVDIVDRYNHALQIVRDSASISTGDLKIGHLGVGSYKFLSKFITKFTASHPLIRLHFSSDDVDTLVGELSSGNSDLAFVTLVDKNYLTGLESLRIMDSRLYMLCHPLNPAAQLEHIHVKDLSGMPFINFSGKTNPLTYDYNRQLFKKAGAECNIVQEVPNIESSLLQLSIDAGIFFIPEYLLNYYEDTLVKKPIEDDFATITMNLIWKKKNPNPSISLFVEDFKAFMDNTPLFEDSKD